MYKVVEYFTDLKDGCHAYNVGDVYPRQGFEASEKRLHELSTNANRRKRPLIEKVEEPKPVPVIGLGLAEEVAKQPKKRGKKSANRDMSGDKELV